MNRRIIKNYEGSGLSSQLNQFWFWPGGWLVLAPIEIYIKRSEPGSPYSTETAPLAAA
jgi:hypothetical protein